MCKMDAIVTTDGDLQSRIEIRRSNKPLMEKKRRQRINRCLNDLKSLVLEALKKDPSRYSKLEKADILEMTVRHVQALHRHQSAGGRLMGGRRAVSGEDKAKYRAGFIQCAVEVSRYLSSTNGVPHDLHSKVIGHLNSVTSNLTGVPGATGQASVMPAGGASLVVGGGVLTVTPPMSTHTISSSSPSSSLSSSPSLSSSSSSSSSSASASTSSSSLVVTTAADSSTGFQRFVDKDDSAPTYNPSISLTPVEPRDPTPTLPVKVDAGVTLVPARLASGQMALVLPPGNAFTPSFEQESADKQTSFSTSPVSGSGRCFTVSVQNGQCSTPTAAFYRGRSFVYSPSGDVSVVRTSDTTSKEVIPSTSQVASWSSIPERSVDSGVLASTSTPNLSHSSYPHVENTLSLYEHPSASSSSTIVEINASHKDDKSIEQTETLAYEESEKEIPLTSSCKDLSIGSNLSSQTSSFLGQVPSPSVAWSSNPNNLNHLPFNFSNTDRESSNNFPSQLLSPKSTHTPTKLVKPTPTHPKGVTPNSHRLIMNIETSSYPSSSMSNVNPYPSSTPLAATQSCTTLTKAATPAQISTSSPSSCPTAPCAPSPGQEPLNLVTNNNHSREENPRESSSRPIRARSSSIIKPAPYHVPERDIRQSDPWRPW